MGSVYAAKRKTRPRERLVIALDDLDFSWTNQEIMTATLLWNLGTPIKIMAKKLRPHDSIANGIDEVALLIMHLKRQGKIRNREGGVFGNKK